jgi:hypothetical protein
MGKKTKIISVSLETYFLVKILKFLKFFDADPDPGSGYFLTLDSGWKKFGSDQLCDPNLIAASGSESTLTAKAKHMDP